MEYEWKNKETGEIITHNHYRNPPDLPGQWERVFAFGLGSVQGAGGSPGRPSVRGKDGQDQ